MEITSRGSCNGLLGGTPNNNKAQKVKMSLYICAVTEVRSLLIYKRYKVYITRQGSEKSVHMCSLTRAFSAHLQTL